VQVTGADTGVSHAPPGLRLLAGLYDFTAAPALVLDFCRYDFS